MSSKNPFEALGSDDWPALDADNDTNSNAHEPQASPVAAGASAPSSPSSAAAHSPSVKYPLIWIDLEMTGLDIQNDTILQIACIITDGSLQTLIEGEEITIHHDEVTLATMNEWCVENHGRSGLTQAVRDSTVSLAEAEAATLEFIRRHVPEPGAAQIAGSSVHVDVAFMRRLMPSIIEHCHYRLVDVSSIGECVRRWLPRTYGRAPKKKLAHTALSDIRESIDQLRYYKEHAFIQKDAKGGGHASAMQVIQQHLRGQGGGSKGRARLRQ